MVAERGRAREADRDHCLSGGVRRGVGHCVGYVDLVDVRVSDPGDAQVGGLRVAEATKSSERRSRP